MKKTTLKILISILAFFTVSCNNSGGKASYISSFERFVNSVSEKQDSYTDEDWEKTNARFEQFANTEYQKYSRNLTREEKQKIGKLKGKYLAIRAKSEVGNLMDNLQNALEELNDVVEGFTEEFDIE